MRHTETIRRVMEGDYSQASADEKREASKDVIQVCAAAAAAVTVQPFPFVDTALLIPIQIGMVQAVGRVHGYRLDKKSVLEMLSTFGASLVAQNVIMAAAKFVPFLGWLVSISMAYALTYAIGEVSHYYFESGRGVSTDELRSRFNQIYKEKKAEKERAHKGNSTLKDKLEQLKQAKESGILTEEEFERKKQEILANF